MLGHIFGGQTECPAYQKECRNGGRENHFARCCKRGAQKRPKGSITTVWHLPDKKDQPSDSKSKESELNQSVYVEHFQAR